MLSKALKVNKTEAESTKKELLKNNFFRKNLRIIRNTNFIYLPVTDDYPGETVTIDFPEIEKKPHNYREYVELPAQIIKLLPTSYDVIGSTALIKLPDVIKKHALKIGTAILKTHKNIKTVLLDSGVKTVFRVRDVEFICGEKKFETTHREHGLKFEVDLSKVYFSPRLATERKRISRKIEDGETILDMFSGVGPFSIYISKFSSAEKIYSCDNNQDAIFYLNKNIELNKVKNIYVLFCDAKELPSKIGKVDRIIMNLPHGGSQFLETAIKLLKEDGTIYYYEITERKKLNLRIIEIEKSTGSKVTERRKVHEYSPTEAMYCYEIMLKC